ncbi:hypothetical protein CR513_15425, partial [Mucuna pruriens]
MDIWLVYSCLLGRPWIHAARVIPFSLHQKVKFIMDRQLISVMGEKELIINTPLPAEYIEGDEEALETSFQALEIIGIASAKVEGGDPKPSRAAVMATKVLISNGFQLGKGLGRELHNKVEPITIQENMGQSGLGYTRAARRENPGRGSQSKQRIRPDLYRYFTSGGIISVKQIVVVEDQPIKLAKWVYPMIDNMTLMFDNAGKSNRSDEGDDWEEEDLEELERVLEQERPRLQFEAKEIEVINLGEEDEVKEIRVGKLMLLDLRQRLVELLREYADIFAWSYRDMMGLDTTIVEHRLPLDPNVVPIRQKLRRMKPKVVLKIREEVEKQWNAGFLAVAEYP